MKLKCWMLTRFNQCLVLLLMLLLPLIFFWDAGFLEILLVAVDIDASGILDLLGCSGIAELGFLSLRPVMFYLLDDWFRLVCWFSGNARLLVVVATPAGFLG